MGQSTSFDLYATDSFKRWFWALSDVRAQKRIAQRIIRIQAGLFDDSRMMNFGLCSIKVDHRPNYRIYYLLENESNIVILNGGTIGSEAKDIRDALALAELLRE